MHAPRIQNYFTLSNSYLATSYSSLANDLFTFSFVERIASDIIESFIKHSQYKLSIEALIRKNNLFKYKPYIIKKIQSMLANKRNRSYFTLDKIVIACLHDLGF